VRKKRGRGEEASWSGARTPALLASKIHATIVSVPAASTEMAAPLYDRAAD
jgi:hypothetical protein